MSTRQSRSKSRSPRNSISLSKRRALHARSDSDTNELAGKHAAGLSDEDQVYRQSPFPRLPSQALSPKGSLSIFEDQTATSAVRSDAKTATKPLQVSRLPRAPSPKGRVKSKATVFSDAANAGSVKEPRPSSKPGDRGTPRDPLRANPVQPTPASSRPGRASSRVRSIVSAIESASGENDSGPPTPKPPTPKSRVVKSPRFTEKSTNDASVPALPPVLPQLEALSSHFDRPTSPVEIKTYLTSLTPNQTTNPLARPSPVLVELAAVQDVSQPANPLPVFRPAPTGSGNGRPRSASIPTAPMDAFLQALVAEGTYVQYPKLEKRSVTSLRTDTSSVRGAAPKPLRLRRKRARSHLSRAESAADEDDYELSDNDNHAPVVTAGEGRPVTPPTVIEPDSGRWTPGRWTAELEDTVAPLDRHPLRAQHSYYRDRERNRERDLSDSRPTSKSSMESSSSSGGFYRFLNDSRTAWAKSYYCNEGALRQVTPPHVTQMTNMRPPTTPTSRSYSLSASGPTRTPDSDGYTESIYVPRARPFQARPIYDELSIWPPSSEEALPPSSIRSMSIGTIEEPRQEHNATSNEPSSQQSMPAVRQQHTNSNGLIARPRPEAHLSPDRGVSVRYSLLQAPSLDGTNWRSPVNVQVGLFIFGIIFPFSWMIAACLPLPPRPHIQQPPADLERPEIAAEVSDLFQHEDVKRWQKVRWWRNFNRFMSVTGLCVIATIIALAIVGTH